MTRSNAGPRTTCRLECGSQSTFGAQACAPGCVPEQCQWLRPTEHRPTTAHWGSARTRASLSPGPDRCASNSLRFCCQRACGWTEDWPPKMYFGRSQRADFGTCGACGQVLRSRRLCKDKRKQAHRRARQLHSARRSVNVYREVFTLNRSTAPIQVENAREKIMS